MNDDALQADPEGLGRLAGQLREAASELERAAQSPPPMPQVTVSSDKVGDTLSTIEKTVAGLIASAHKDADDVHSSSGSYRNVENTNIDLLQREHGGLPE